MLGWRDTGIPEPVPSTEGPVCGWKWSLWGRERRFREVGMGRGQKPSATEGGRWVRGRVAALGVGQDTVPACPGVSQEIGYLYGSSWPQLSVTQTQHDGQMELVLKMV